MRKVSTSGNCRVFLKIYNTKLKKIKIDDDVMKSGFVT
jgi:hypothetical protein